MWKELYDLLFEAKYILLIYAAFGFVYIVRLNDVYLRFFQSWILVTSFEALAVFIFFGIKNKGGKRNAVNIGKEKVIE